MEVGGTRQDIASSGEKGEASACLEKAIESAKADGSSIEQQEQDPWLVVLGASHLFSAG